MKLGSLKNINPFAKTELSEEVTQGLANLFGEELPRVMTQPSVKEYYEEEKKYPSGYVAEKGDFKDRGLQDPYRNFIAQIYAVIFQQDSRFDLESDAYPYGGLKFDTLKDPRGKEATEIQHAFETSFAERGFRKIAGALSARIADEYRKFGRNHTLDKNKPDHLYIEGSVRSIIEALSAIRKGDENARMNFSLGVVKIPSRKLN